MITSEKARQIALEYKKTGFANKTLALINVGYKPSYAESGRRECVYGNERVKNEIKRLQTEAEEKIEVNRELVTNNMINAARIALENKDTANYIRASENLGKHVGWYQADNEQGRNPVPDLTPEEIETYKEIAKEVERRKHIKVHQQAS